MASEFKKGDGVFFAFYEGVSMLDSQRHPRMYKSLNSFKGKCPITSQPEVEVVKYVPDPVTKEFVGRLNAMLRMAVYHGGDPGGSYFSEPDRLEKAIQDFMALLNVPYGIVWTDEVGNENPRYKGYPEIILKKEGLE